MMVSKCGGTLTVMSTSPDCSAATRTACSGIGRNTSVLTLGAPPHQCSLASSTICSSLTQRTNRSCWVKDEQRSEEHTSELQSRPHLVCRLLLDNKQYQNT